MKIPGIEVPANLGSVLHYGFRRTEVDECPKQHLLPHEVSILMALVPCAVALDDRKVDMIAEGFGSFRPEG
eukprot:16416372-Heterocapsa_arctica.AAC.1